MSESNTSKVGNRLQHVSEKYIEKMSQYRKKHFGKLFLWIWLSIGLPRNLLLPLLLIEVDR